MDLNQFKLSGSKDRLATLKLQNARLIKLRWFYIGVLTSVAAISSLIAGLPTETARQYVIICSIAFFINAIIYTANKRNFFGEKSTYALLVSQLVLDVAIAGFVTYQQGGVSARTTILFALPIVAGGLIFSRKVVYSISFLAGLGYVLAIMAVILQSDKSFEASEVMVPIIFYPVFFFLLAKLVVFLMNITTSETRNEAYDAFLALLTHQLVHPASTARAIIDQLEHTPRNEHAEIKKYINMLKTENNNLLSLLNNLLETSSVYRLSGEQEIEINSLLKVVANKTSENFDRKEDLVLDLGKSDQSVFGIRNKLITAFVNVLNNAFQYSESGSKVIVTLRRSGNDALIVIQDEGGGFSDYAKKNMFKKYAVNFEGKHGLQGLGLGLFVAKKVIEAHRGSIHIFPDKIGTRVMIKLKRGRHHD